MKAFLVCLSLFLVFSSCQLSESEKYKSVERIDALAFGTDLIASRVITFEDKISITNPLQVLNIQDQFLLITEYRPRDFFQVFSLPELDFLYSTGKQGRGPNEFITTPTYFNVDDAGQLIVYDPLLQRLRYIEVNDSSLIENKYESLSYDGQLEPLNRIRRINDSTYFASYGSSIEETNREHIALRPNSTDSLFTFGEYPASEYEGFERYSIYGKSNLSKPDGLKFATFYFSENMIKIYNREGTLLKQILVTDHEFNNSKKEGFLYRTGAYASNKYIYILGLNGTDDNLYDSPSSTHKTSLEIWTWEGKPVYRAKFDRLIHRFTVSEKHNKIYGVSNYSESKIYEYDLNPIQMALDAK